MFKHILIPTDGSDLARKAVLYGIQLAKGCGAKVTALTISEPRHIEAMEAVIVQPEASPFAEKARQNVENILARVTTAAEAAGVECDAIHEIHDQPYRAIIDTAHAKGCDLIIMASHGRRGLSALLLGSGTSKVLTHSTIPVLVYR